MPRDRTIDDLIFMRDSALEKVARLEGQLKDEPRHYQGQTKYRIRLARQRASQLEKEIDAMRHKDEFVPQSGNPAWPWRAWVTLDLEGRRYGRGHVIPDDVIERSANAGKLISGGYIRRLPESQPRQAPTPKPVAPSVPVDLEFQTLIEAQDAVRAAAEKRHTDRRSAVDLIDPNLLERAGTVWGAWPRMARVGGWGSGGGRLMRVGAGAAASGLRPTDDFIDMLISDNRPPPRSVDRPSAA
jgi:hypothetical protein